VEQRRGHEEIGVEPRMKLTELPDERPDRDGVLDQTPDVGVMPGSGAGSPPELGCDRIAEEDSLDDRPERGVVDLAREVLQKALQLLGIAIRRGEKGSGVEIGSLEPRNVLDLDDQLAAKPLDLPGNADRVAPLEARREPIDIPKRPRRDRTGPVPQLQGEIDRAVPGREPVLAHARIDAAEAPSGREFRDRGRAV
jgi:hypothetical protein